MAVPLAIQRSDHIGPEAYRVIILFIQGDPGHVEILCRERMHPGGEQGGLAEAGGGRDEGEVTLKAGREQQVCQTRASNQGMRGRWNEEFGGQELLVGKW
jgi:hypothetical protein